MTNRETKELKQQIKDTQNALVNLVKLVATAKSEDKATHTQELAKVKGQIAELQERLKKLKSNPTGSGYFEFQPHLGMNRQQAKAFRKQHKHDLNKRSTRNVDSSARLNDQASR